MMKLTIFILTEQDSSPLNVRTTPETSWNGDIEATLSGWRKTTSSFQAL
jgi:hypothetical protein